MNILANLLKEPSARTSGLAGSLSRSPEVDLVSAREFLNQASSSEDKSFIRRSAEDLVSLNSRTPGF